MDKEKFKIFVNNHPTLITYVNAKKKSWQDFYELYSLYGEQNDVWEPYFVAYNNQEDKVTVGAASNFVDSFTNVFKNVDVKQIQNGITNVQKVLGLVGDLFIKDEPKIDNTASSYIPRAINRKFDD